MSWSERQRTNESLVCEEFSAEKLSKELALSKMMAAQVDFDFEQLHLKYLQLEKTVCKLKLDNARLQAQLDEFYKKPRDVRELDLNDVEISLFGDVVSGEVDGGSSDIGELRTDGREIDSMSLIQPTGGHENSNIDDHRKR